MGANPAKSNTLGEKVLKGPGVGLLISKTNFLFSHLMEKECTDILMSQMGFLIERHFFCEL